MKIFHSFLIVHDKLSNEPSMHSKQPISRLFISNWVKAQHNEFWRTFEWSLAYSHFESFILLKVDLFIESPIAQIKLVFLVIFSMITLYRFSFFCQFLFLFWSSVDSGFIEYDFTLYGLICWTILGCLYHLLEFINCSSIVDQSLHEIDRNWIHFKLLH